MTRKTASVGVIANKKAGLLKYRDRKREEQPLNKVDAYCKRHGIPFYATSTVDEVQGVLLELVNTKGIKRLGVLGGDGSVHRVVNTLISAKLAGTIEKIPKIGSLGGGTMDAVHEDWLGWKIPPVEVLKLIHRTVAYVPLRRCRPLRLSYTSTDGSAGSVYGFMLIIGPIAAVIEEYTQQGKTPANGARNIALAMVASVTGRPEKYAAMLHKTGVRIIVDGRELALNEILSVITSVTQNLIFGIQPYVDSAEPNQFSALAADVKAWQATALFPVLYRARRVIPSWLRDRVEQMMFNRSVHTMEIRFTQVTGDPNWVNFDGENIKRVDLTKPLILDLEGVPINLISRFG